MIILMYIYLVVLFILLTFSRVAISAVTQKVLSVAKFIADIHEELPNNCVYIMKTDGEQKSENYIFFLQE
jgi:hypothetical protein